MVRARALFFGPESAGQEFLIGQSFIISREKRAKKQKSVHVRENVSGGERAYNTIKVEAPTWTVVGDIFFP